MQGGMPLRMQARPHQKSGVKLSLPDALLTIQNPAPSNFSTPPRNYTARAQQGNSERAFPRYRNFVIHHISFYFSNLPKPIHLRHGLLVRVEIWSAGFRSRGTRPS